MGIMVNNKIYNFISNEIIYKFVIILIFFQKYYSLQVKFYENSFFTFFDYSYLISIFVLWTISIIFISTLIFRISNYHFLNFLLLSISIITFQSLYYNYVLIFFLIFLSINLISKSFKKNKNDFFNILFIIIFILVFYSAFSPIYKGEFFLNQWTRGDWLFSMQYQYENMKLFSFGTKSFFEDSNNYSLVHYSPVFSFISFILDLPVGDLKIFGTSMQFYNILLLIFFAVSSYYFLNKALKITKTVSFFGSLVMIFGNSVLISLSGREFYIYVVYLFFLPSILFFLLKYINTNNSKFLIKSALIFFVIDLFHSGHPEMKMFLLMCILINAFFLVLFLNENLKDKFLKIIKTSLIFCFTFILTFFLIFYQILIDEIVLYDNYPKKIAWESSYEMLFSIFFPLINLNYKEYFTVINMGRAIFYYLNPIFSFIAFILLLGLISKIFKIKNYEMDKLSLSNLEKAFIFTSLLILFFLVSGNYNPFTFFLDLTNTRFQFFPRLNLIFKFYCIIIFCLIFDSFFKKNIFLFFSKKYINIYIIFTLSIYFITSHYFYKIESENLWISFVFIFFSYFFLWLIFKLIQKNKKYSKSIPLLIIILLSIFWSPENDNINTFKYQNSKYFLESYPTFERGDQRYISENLSTLAYYAKVFKHDFSTKNNFNKTINKYKILPDEIFLNLKNYSSEKNKTFQEFLKNYIGPNYVFNHLYNNNFIYINFFFEDYSKIFFKIADSGSLLFAHPNMRAECGLNNANQIWPGNEKSRLAPHGSVYDCPKFNEDLKTFINELKEKNFNYLVLSKKFITNNDFNYEYIEIFDEIWENLIIIKLNDNNFLNQNPTKSKSFRIKKITPDKIYISLDCLKIKCNQVLNIYPSRLLKIKDKNRNSINYNNLDNKIIFSLDEGNSDYLIYYDKTIFNYFYVFSILSLIVIFRGKFVY